VLQTHDAILDLGQLVTHERQRIVRLWAKRLRSELHEYELPLSELQAGLEHNISELGRLLTERGEEAIELWAEAVRPLGMSRFDQHFEPDDLAREFKVLHQLLLRQYTRRYRRLEPELAEFLAALFGEAIGAVQASFARILKTEEVRFRDAALMESVLHHVDVGILVAEPDGTLSYATAPVSRLFGVPLRAFLGPRAPKTLAAVLHQMNARHPEGTPFRVEDMPFARALEQKSAVRGVQMMLERPPRSQPVLIEMAAIPLLEEGPERELLGVIQTMTDRTEAANQTRQLSEAHDEVRRLQGRLLQRMRTEALGQLAASTAHSLNNFLNVLRLRITLLRKEPRPEHLDALDRTVRNVGELVSKLQDFAAVRTDEQLVALPLTQVVREALDLVRPELAHSDPPVRLEFSLQSRGVVRVDASTLRELLINLVLSAKERSPEAGQLELRTFDDGGHSHIELRDFGPPMTDEELAQLFDPLKANANAPHLSLLLAVARNQLQRWGGELVCENCARPESDSGATRWVLRLPMVEERELTPPPVGVHKTASFSRPHLTGAHRVLVVDDDPENARMLAEVLSDEGYEVKVAHSGDAALHAWERHQFDAALLDGLMPDISGWALARQLRARAPTVLLAMITGGDVRGQNRGDLALVDAVFRKPIDVSALDEFLSQDSDERSSSQEHPTLPP
jgi:two-component system, cell cycle sensor histidine kinase and response regulator CckA